MKKILDDCSISNYVVFMEQQQIIALISKIRYSANELIMRELEKNGISGIVPSHGEILVRLFRKDSIPMSELAAAINRKKNTVTTLIDKLVNLGFVTKTSDPDDSRITLVKLTHEGRSLQKSFDKVSSVLLDTVYTGITEREKESVLKVLLKMKKNLE